MQSKLPARRRLREKLPCWFQSFVSAVRPSLSLPLDTIRILSRIDELKRTKIRHLNWPTTNVNLRSKLLRWYRLQQVLKPQLNKHSDCSRNPFNSTWDLFHIVLSNLLQFFHYLSATLFCYRLLQNVLANRHWFKREARQIWLLPEIALWLHLHGRSERMIN